MLELNCSYEESKKILELGYDFSYICYEYQEDEHSYPCRSHPSEVPEGIPIIPKAALEACLPEFKDQRWFGHTLFDMEMMEYSPDLISIAYSNLRKSYKCDFKSALEAFLWCHENYPEELKKKFDEVMA